MLSKQKQLGTRTTGEHLDRGQQRLLSALPAARREALCRWGRCCGGCRSRLCRACCVSSRCAPGRSFGGGRRVGLGGRLRIPVGLLLCIVLRQELLRGPAFLNNNNNGWLPAICSSNMNKLIGYIY